MPVLHGTAEDGGAEQRTTSAVRATCEGSAGPQAAAVLSSRAKGTVRQPPLVPRAAYRRAARRRARHVPLASAVPPRTPSPVALQVPLCGCRGVDGSRVGPVPRPLMARPEDGIRRWAAAWCARGEPASGSGRSRRGRPPGRGPDRPAGGGRRRVGNDRGMTDDLSRRPGPRAGITLWRPGRGSRPGGSASAERGRPHVHRSRPAGDVPAAVVHRSRGAPGRGGDPDHVTDWVADKTRWALSIDAAEQAALSEELSHCADVPVTVVLARCPVFSSRAAVAGRSCRA